MSLLRRLDSLEDLFDQFSEESGPSETALSWGAEAGLTPDETAQIWRETALGRTLSVEIVTALIAKIHDAGCRKRLQPSPD